MFKTFFHFTIATTNQRRPLDGLVKTSSTCCPFKKQKPVKVYDKDTGATSTDLELWNYRLKTTDLLFTLVRCLLTEV